MIHQESRSQKPWKGVILAKYESQTYRSVYATSYFFLELFFYYDIPFDLHYNLLLVTAPFEYYTLSGLC